ncbi:MAG: response regulator [Candidatus Phaeomarinobacter sp.]
MSADSSSDDLEFFDRDQEQTAAPATKLAQPPITKPAPLPLLASSMVLVVDDQRTVRKAVRRILEDAGIAWIAEAPSGQNALELISMPGAPTPDVIITDLMMEKTDGLGLMQAVRISRNKNITRIPMIVLTASNDKMVHEIAHDLGSARVLMKPSSPAEITSAVLEATATSTFG